MSDDESPVVAAGLAPPVDAEQPPLPAPERRLGGRLFWLSAALGWAVIAYGLRGVVLHRVDTRPANLGAFVVGGALAHDLLFAPVVLVAGVTLAAVVRGRARPWVQAALVISGCVALFSYPLVRDYARVLHNPSSLPRDYVANLGITVAIVWVLALLAAATTVLRARRRTADRHGQG
ncbi:MAG: hypothetical protein JO265_03135 [Acidimicrobiia bacterium]|nr:hypothetical protein [Acidimicrobiia bacterium]